MNVEFLNGIFHQLNIGRKFQSIVKEFAIVTSRQFCEGLLVRITVPLPKYFIRNFLHGFRHLVVFNGFSSKLFMVSFGLASGGLSGPYRSDLPVQIGPKHKSDGLYQWLWN